MGLPEAGVATVKAPAVKAQPRGYAHPPREIVCTAEERVPVLLDTLTVVIACACLGLLWA